MITTATLVAVDVSKDSLEVKTENLAVSVANTKPGIARMLRRLGAADGLFVVCEATGGYERQLVDILHGTGVPVSRANAARVRAFAASEGIRAKTDPIDAGVILAFAREKELRPTVPQEPGRKRLAAYLDRRNHLKEMAAREKNRLQNSPGEIHASIRRTLGCITGELKEIERAIRDTVRADTRMTAQVECLKRIKGVGEVTAWTVVAFLGEIDRLTRNQLSALVGVAPFNRDSGVFKGKRKVVGGRAKVRSVLYMAARTAASHNPVIKAYTEGLQARGKPYKCAMVAAMRKLLIHMRSELKNLNLELAT